MSFPPATARTRSPESPEKVEEYKGQSPPRSRRGRFGKRKDEETVDRQHQNEDLTESTEPSSSSDLGYIYEHDVCPKCNVATPSTEETPPDVNDDTVDLMKIVESRSRAASLSQNAPPTTAMALQCLNSEGKTIPPSRKAALRYLEEEPLQDLEQGIASEGADSDIQLEQPDLRRQNNRQGVADMQPGAYSGSFGEAYERLEKAQHCRQSLGACACLEDGTDTRPPTIDTELKKQEGDAKEDAPKRCNFNLKVLIVASLLGIAFGVGIPLLIFLINPKTWPWPR